MSTFRLFNYQARRMVATGALLFATLVPALVPALVSAETVTERSVELSSSVKATSGVDYTVNFKTATAATGAFVIDFCTDSVVGTPCTTPPGLTVGTPTTTSLATVSAIDGNTVKVVLDASADNVGDPVSVVLGGLTNPTATDPIYARIVTYTNGTAAGTNDSATPGTYLDKGSIALSITDGFGVSGSVLESLTFCASAPYEGANPIDDDCAAVADKALATPNVSLGTNGVLSTTLSEGTIYSQISTNAAHGAVVNLRNSTAGGGLKRVEATTSDITPFTGSPVGTAAAIASDAAKFGLKLGGLTSDTGAVRAVNNYSAAGYMMNYDSNNETGVTSPYGDKIYDTSGAPISNGMVDLTFGADISNVTPAGNYSAALNLIATGTF